jgi:sirohydrochlorin ferrochelatase
MRALLLVAHGSRREASNAEVRALTKRVAERAGARYDLVECAFLELAPPSIPDGIQGCIDRGADEVVVLPYFLSAGRHVAEDIPNDVKRKQDEHPRVNIRIAPYVGGLEGIAELLLAAAD